MNIIEIAKDVIKTESEEVLNLQNYIDNQFEQAVLAIYKSDGKVVISGMGKSGLIGKKIAATLASTGTPSFFLHPGEAYHGDLGMIEKNDIVILISNSGETDEVLKLIPFLKSKKNITISLTGNTLSSLASNTDYHINIGVQKEACPLQLAPTCSTTATLVIGDAIAITLMHLRNFKIQDFAQFHPGGSLGRRLITKVENVMKKDKLPTCVQNTGIKDIIQTITKGKCGLVVILDDNIINGIITDGDIRRAMESQEINFFSIKARDIMTPAPITINQNEKLKLAGDIMNQKKINSLLVTDDKGKLSGIIQMYDLGF